MGASLLTEALALPPLDVGPFPGGGSRWRFANLGQSGCRGSLIRAGKLLTAVSPPVLTRPYPSGICPCPCWQGNWGLHFPGPSPRGWLAPLLPLSPDPSTQPQCRLGGPLLFFGLGQGQDPLSPFSCLHGGPGSGHPLQLGGPPQTASLPRWGPSALFCCRWFLPSPWVPWPPACGFAPSPCVANPLAVTAPLVVSRPFPLGSPPLSWQPAPSPTTPRSSPLSRLWDSSPSPLGPAAADPAVGALHGRSPLLCWLFAGAPFRRCDSVFATVSHLLTTFPFGAAATPPTPATPPARGSAGKSAQR